VDVQEAFTSGNPQAAWAATQRVISMAHALQKEAATSRFKANYGTSVCEHCDGLKAGPGVAATCFQLKQCYYTNLKVGADKKQARLIERLTKPDPDGE
jgi:TPR repeat protein